MSVSSSSSSSSSSSLSLSTMQINVELWMVAEERAQEILNTIQPVFISYRSRNEIIDYLQTIVKDRLGLEVFNFGSVPLKIYLPDGDIDLTILTPRDKEEDLAKTLCSMLEAEDGEFDFHVTDVQYIQAQVKVIKCKIINIDVDISFNQMAGLSALCFLEQVDQIFWRDHMVKRSIFLVKAWCYYESRILGANIGLISTYALAVLVLHIINISYSSLFGPLAVSNNCITINGPVLISSLPDMTKTEHHEIVLNENFLRECMELYSNNLGRSVTQGNVQRLKHAFTLGARKLKDILTLPGETMGWKLEKFFGNSLEKNGKEQRIDVEELVTTFGTGRSDNSEEILKDTSRVLYMGSGFMLNIFSSNN
ncbi:hypothetical protein Bca101_080597 [Brassica carinata]